ncbi:MAG: hypothetical protein JWM75_1960 [Sphingomonas bacterium]|nr:hypothetical protein [Sphingomonas bacterium]
MAGTERANYVRGTRAERIGALNDDLRTHGAGGLLTITRGIAALGPELVSSILAVVRTFDAFDTRNDPYGEHDLGILQVGGRSIRSAAAGWDGRRARACRPRGGRASARPC